jgi:hypothetical protein
LIGRLQIEYKVDRSRRCAGDYGSGASMRVAVLGCGGAGACVALELAQKGCHVDIFERNQQLVWGASRVNEGKIHQGFIYANDDPDQTARLMATGALDFTHLLRRWIDIDEAIKKSTPFIYAVHKASMLSVDQVRNHFEACCRIFRSIHDNTGQRYIDSHAPIGYRELTRDELADAVDPDCFLSAFETSEFAVDPRPIADKLGQAVLATDNISLISPVTVLAVERGASRGFRVVFSDSQKQSAGPYDHVVNTLWDGRLKIDQGMGLTPPRPWSFRHKFGSRVAVSLKPSDLPSITCVLGPFGDIVNFGSNGFFLSWYPIGMVSMTGEIEPPPDWTAMSRQARLDVFNRSRDEWIKLCPKLADLSYDEQAIDPESGVIYALGDTDIDDQSSRLHTRFEIGVRSVDRYHSVNTGKYTLMPHIAFSAANRVLEQQA